MSTSNGHTATRPRLRRTATQILLERYHAWDNDWSCTDLWRETKNDYYGVPPSQPSDRKGGGKWPLWSQESDLDRIRQQCRILCETNPYAVSLRENLISHIAGKPFSYKFISKENTADSDPAKQQRTQYLKTLIAKAQDEWDRFCLRNRWNGKTGPMALAGQTREQEILGRLLRDGEAFLRYFVVDGHLVIRFIEPEQVRNPLGAKYADGWSFGIQCDVRDVETVQTYHVVWIDPTLVNLTSNAPTDGEDVEADEIDHLKGPRTDSTIRRGTSPFAFGVAAALERARVLERNTSLSASAKAAIAETWKHLHGTEAEVQAFRTGQREGHIDRSTDDGTSKTDNYELRQPGMVRDVPDGMEPVYPAPDNSAVYLEVVQADLRAACAAFAAPEIFTGDASNGNYASLKEASAPFVKFAEAYQLYLGAVFARVAWRVIALAVEQGRLPRDVMTLLDLQVEGPQVYQRDALQRAQEAQIYAAMRVWSPQTIAMETGKDVEVEQKNIEQFEQRFGPMGQPLGMGGPEMPGLPDTHGMGDDAGGALHESVLEAGTCKPGETAAKTGCVPSGDGGTATAKGGTGASEKPQGDTSTRRYGDKRDTVKPDSGSADGTDWKMEPARYAKNSVAFRHQGDGEWKSRGDRLAQAVGGRWNNREKAYIMSVSKGEKLKQMLKDGWDASAITNELHPPKVEVPSGPATDAAGNPFIQDELHKAGSVDHWKMSDKQKERRARQTELYTHKYAGGLDAKGLQDKALQVKDYLNGVSSRLAGQSAATIQYFKDDVITAQAKALAIATLLKKKTGIGTESVHEGRDGQAAAPFESLVEAKGTCGVGQNPQRDGCAKATDDPKADKGKADDDAADKGDSLSPEDDYAKNGVRAKAFKEWFGDWEKDPANASKVVNKTTGEPQETNGIPQIVYHGTPNGDFQSFAAQAGGRDEGWFGRGHYFTEDKAVAKKFETPGSKSPQLTATNPQTIEAYLNVKNPLRLESLTLEQLKPLKLSDRSMRRIKEALETDLDYPKARAIHVAFTLKEVVGDVTSLAKRLGHDGIHVPSVEGGTWVAFEPNQIKAVKNKGTFNPKSAKLHEAAGTCQQGGTATEGAALHSCVNQVRAKGDADEPWAVCKASLGECEEGDCQCQGCRDKRAQPLMEDAAVLDVPDENQDTSYSCGAAAAVAVCRYFGVEPDTESEAIRALGSSPRDGTDPEHIVQVLQDNGLETTALAGMDLDDLEHYLGKGRPVLVCYQAWGTDPAEYDRLETGHWAVVIGIDASDTYLMDPAGFEPSEVPTEYGGRSLGGQKVAVPRERFDALWKDVDGEMNVYNHYGIVARKPVE